MFWSNDDLVGRRDMRLRQRINQQSEVLGWRAMAKRSMLIQVHFLGHLESRFIFSVHLEYRFMSLVHQES